MGVGVAVGCDMGGLGVKVGVRVGDCVGVPDVVPVSLAVAVKSGPAGGADVGANKDPLVDAGSVRCSPGASVTGCVPN